MNTYYEKDKRFDSQRYDIIGNWKPYGFEMILFAGYFFTSTSVQKRISYLTSAKNTQHCQVWVLTIGDETIFFHIRYP